MSSPYNGKDAKNIILCYFKEYASVVEWSITTDCKSVAFGLRRFESFPTHNLGRIGRKPHFALYCSFSVKKELYALIYIIPTF